MDPITQHRRKCERDTVSSIADLDLTSHDDSYVFFFDGKPIIRTASTNTWQRSRDYARLNCNFNNNNKDKGSPSHLKDDEDAEMRGRATSDPSGWVTSSTRDPTSPPRIMITPESKGSPPPSAPAEPKYRYRRQQTGIYGWRKRWLYFTLAALTALLLLNLGLTLWMIRLLRFSWRGMGNMRIMPDGVVMNGKTVFNKELRISEIRPSQNGNLRLLSDRSIIMKAQDHNGNLANQIYIGPNGFISQGPRFKVNNKDGHTLFEVTPDNMSLSVGTLHINNKNGARFSESVITPMVRSPPGQPLRLESLTRALEIEASGVSVKALAGEINALSLSDITLSSKAGKIKLEGDIYMPDLAILTPSTSSLTPEDSNAPGRYQGIFQVCLCESGRLFLALPTSNCRGTYDICSAPL